ncbi:hypothetical protein C4B68_37335 [Streptomyces dengpaensis]|uniref:Integral membrane protein n=1 Tax=Streptomyces dengpaensis TaxID=2049881 RepID=A0ABN5IEM0_9ACTN|nr:MULTISPECIES: streptophobe family protein [Streptomyces]AVH61639.1 hypothetical protein C4B68_37335 [Streptomyces dengpaensis]
MIVLTGMIVMGVVAALGLWAAGAANLPGNAFPRVVAATVVTALGGHVEFAGDGGVIADTQADLTVTPLSVTLAGALVISAGFLRPVRQRAVAGTAELAGWAARIAVLWVPALVALALFAHQNFTMSLGNGIIDDIGDSLGATPEAGFQTDMAPALVFGALWLAGVFVLALLVSRAAPLPARLSRFRESVRPAAFAMVALLLAYVALGVVIGLLVAATRGRAPETFAVILLGLPNLVWLGFTIGLGATWNGRVDEPFGLPMPHPLDAALRTPDVATLHLNSLADYDGRVWWLVVVDAVLLVAAAFLMAVRSPARMRARQHAVHMAVALALTVLMICLVGRVSAHYDLSFLGIGDSGGGFKGELLLKPQVWTALGSAVLWGLAAGFLGGRLAKGVHRKS